MKKIFYIFVVIAVCMAFILPAAAIESDGGAVVPEESLPGAESADEAVSAVETSEAVPETSEQDEGSETVGEGAESTGDESEQLTAEIGEVETEDLAAIIGNAESRLEAIVGIAEAMGITLDEAETLLNKIITLGDEHFGESDLWTGIKASILGNPEAWTIVALVVLMFVALAVFLIRGLIKNTTAQATTKANIIDIKKNEAEMLSKMGAASTKLSEIEHEHSDIKLEMDEIRGMAEDMLKIVEESKAEADKIFEMAALMLAAVDSLKANSESSLNVNKEQALQTVQLLNIAMGRQLPRVSESVRKVWYDDAVARIKDAAGVNGETAAKSEQ